ncbi:uncharacterized protein BO95DRAFT_364915, partial [Aspergillus brunneoviolaceus CBS 621.78]
IRLTATTWEEGSSKAKAATAVTKQTNCQFKNHNPDRMGPILFMMNGAAQVPDSSAATAPILIALTCRGVKPV